MVRMAGTSKCFSSGGCKQYALTEFHTDGVNRYDVGQRWCSKCHTYISRNGCYLANGKSTKDTEYGWRCKCCKMLCRMRPRNSTVKRNLQLRLKEKSKIKGGKK